MTQYMGGKHRLAKRIVSVIGEREDVGCWVEPFVGGGSVAAAAASFGVPLVLSDIEPLAAVMWEREGVLPVFPGSLSEDGWRALRDAGGVDKVSAVAAFGASFGGKRWGGYAKPDLRVGPEYQDYFATGVRVWGRKYEAMSGVQVSSLCLPYWRVVPPAGSVVYCDPPYVGTTGYASGGFDHARFYDWCESLSVPVYVSEQSAPAHWETVFEVERGRSVAHGVQTPGVECLFKVVSV